jgi:putative heme iron utilization protein
MMKEEAAERAAKLVRSCKVAALGTLRGGAPSISMVPYAIVAEPFAFIILVSTLSAHTSEMLADGNVGLMIVEPESGAKRVHALARISMQGKAVPVPPDDPRYDAINVTYRARFPDMGGLFELADFKLFAIVPTEIRVIAGFAQAASIAPGSLAKAIHS